MEGALREPTQKDALLDLFVNREDLVSKVEFGGHFGHSDCERTKLKIPVYREKKVQQNISSGQEKKEMSGCSWN